MLSGNLGMMNKLLDRLHLEGFRWDRIGWPVYFFALLSSQMGINSLGLPIAMFCCS